MRDPDRAGSLVVALAVFSVYAIGACPTIYVGDSGELAAAVYLLGIPHPSGYPLYLLLGKVWTLLVPLGSIAYRLSLFSAACAAATTGVVYRLSHRSGLHPMAAALAALLLAFSPSFWGEANVQRVYSLNALFVASATAGAFSWHRSREDRPLLTAFFLSGLGASNHTFMAIQAAAVAAFALVREPSLLRRPRVLILSACAFAAGLLPYIYLPLRSRSDPTLDWGNPETLSNFLYVVLRRDFWARAWIERPADLVSIGADFMRSLGSELVWVGSALALVGAVAGWRRGWPVLLPLLVMAGNFVALVLHGSRTDIFIWHRYYIPSYLMAALLAGMGCHVILEKLPRRLHVLTLALPAVALALGWQAFDRSRYRIAEDFSRTLLRTLPPGAHLSASDDNILFVLIYLHLVEGMRPDVNLILQGVGHAHLPPLKFNPDTEPLFFTHHPNWSTSEPQIVPVGLVFQTVGAGRPLPPPLVTKELLEGETDPRIPKDYLTRNLIGQFHFMLGSSFELTDWKRASREFETALKAAPDNDVLFYNLGLIYRRNGLFEEALDAFRRSHEINPRHIASASRPRASDRVTELLAEVERQRTIAQRVSAELAGLAEGTAAYHDRLARLLEERRESEAARGHRIRAMLGETGDPASKPTGSQR